MSLRPSKAYGRTVAPSCFPLSSCTATRVLREQGAWNISFLYACGGLRQQWIPEEVCSWLTAS